MIMADKKKKKRSSVRTKGLPSRKRPATKDKRVIWRHPLFLLFAFLFFLVSLLIVGGYIHFSKGLPDITRLSNYRYVQPIYIYDRNGKDLTSGAGIRYWTVKAPQIPKVLKDAVVAVEDRRFYSHHGVDVVGIFRALWVNLRKGGISQGGSTITQQLAKNLFLTPQRTFKRKIQELILAQRIERYFTKDEILCLYLNSVYFGSGIYGIGPAARYYFNKDCSRLGLSEASLLAALLKAPEKYSPIRHPGLAYKRRKLVLESMVKCGFITMGKALEAASTPLPSRLYRDKGVRLASIGYFTDWVNERLVEILGEDRVKAGGLKVYTTLDVGLQSYGARALSSVLGSGAAGKKDPLQGALVAIDPHTGGILAMIGGISYKKSQYNRAVKAFRQPGSAFKPIVYAAALSEGFAPETEIVDSPVFIKGYNPKNFDGIYRGPVTLTYALAHSINTVAVKVAQKIGIDKVRQMAKGLGITSPLHSGPSLALGTAEVNLLELTQVYAVFANKGKKVEAHGLVKVLDSQGNCLYSYESSGQLQVLSPEVALEITKMLASVITEGTGRSAWIARPCAGKTGTSSDNRDAWFIGYTPQLVAGVWVGKDSGAPVPGLTGGRVAARIWKGFMTKALKGQPALDLWERQGPPERKIWDVQRGIGTTEAGKVIDAIKKVIEIFLPWKR